MADTKGFEVHRLEGKPIIQLTILPDYTVREHQKFSGPAVRGLMDATSEPLYLLYDLRQLRIEWMELLQGLSSAGDEIKQGAATNYLGTLFVTTDPVVRMGMQALAQRQYGSGNITVFDSVEDAVAYVEQKTG